MEGETRHGIVYRVVEGFLTSHLPIILTILALFVGAFALLATPREEDPQIIVPVADVFVHFPGASAEEVEKLVSTPLERLLWQIDGVEYVYSISRRDLAIVTVRFLVGQDRERSLIKLYNRIESNRDLVPPGVRGWVVKPIEIDDVPIVTLTLHSPRDDDAALRRVGEEVLARLAELPDLSRTEVFGGRPREVRVALDPERLSGHGVSPLEVVHALRTADASLTAGTFARDNRSIHVSTGPFIQSRNDVAQIVVGAHEGRPVYVKDVADVIDGPAEPSTYTRMVLGPAYPDREPGAKSRPAVTLGLAKKKGTNAVTVAEAAIRKVEELRGTIIPDDVEITVTRNTGETANEKVNELLEGLLIAIVTVIALISIALGWREGLIVAVAVPITFGLTLFVNYVTGYSINRVTLFALMVSLGLVVDDPIVDVENIYRHLKMGLQKPLDAVMQGVDEVRPPVILATLAVIASFLPVTFVTGMMGSYMRPMAMAVPVAMLMSMVVAFTITPWMTYQALKNVYGEGSEKEAEGAFRTGWLYRAYSAVLRPFLDRRWASWLLIAGIVVLFGLAMAMPTTRMVPLKMLPFDNKTEVLLVVDMPEGTTLEQTDATVRDLEAYLATVNEVTHCQSYVGVNSPVDFNGLVRHYFLRRAPHLAEIRVNFLPKHDREAQSHEIALRLRDPLTEIAEKHGADLQIVEIPPGPPVIAMLTGEIYGPPDRPYRDLQRQAAQVLDLMSQEEAVRERDSTVEADRERLDFRLDKPKAALHGITTEAIVQTLRVALEGASPATVHLEGERQPLRIRVRLPVERRSGREELAHLQVKAGDGSLVSLDQLGTFERVPEDQPIYHKNLRRVVYAFAEVVGRGPVEALFAIEARLKNNPLPEGFSVDWGGEGEWKITKDAFRDLGLAFGGALIAIYALLIYQTNKFGLPLLIMVSIPLTFIGIMPGFYVLKLLHSAPIGGYANPVFFTATAMIGTIALAGIVVRNSIILIEFIHHALRDGKPLKQALLDSGAVRFRPILLTAATTMLGAWPITTDPIFSGLAWALIFGLFASTFFTLFVIPVGYQLIYAGKQAPAASADPKAG